ncbi:hypothetical protein G6O69_34310 [Pseudenhygromyxa sp. WMMC2535]|uniref:hypothetical protein n=1 Tax=Pseudenhygromyxa sp. WMMC2535 TaxID=2712867 RepID=UPI0015520E8A|nr:hypothetical protein [Pseudenhygromyxa sp. WMMC2535]NVB42946.1 hypothetical protein [Pseudenhygromyxa sp. WMMC2535]
MPDLEINVPDPSRDEVKLGWAFMGPVMLTCGASGDMPPRRFDEWITAMETHDFEYVLGSTIGATSISGMQRRRVVEALKHRRKTVVIIDSRVMRGILTALGWLGLKVRSFSWDALDEAEAYLDVPGFDKGALVDALWTLRQATTGERRATGS